MSTVARVNGHANRITSVKPRRAAKFPKINTLAELGATMDPTIRDMVSLVATGALDIYRRARAVTLAAADLAEQVDTPNHLECDWKRIARSLVHGADNTLMACVLVANGRIPRMEALDLFGADEQPWEACSLMVDGAFIAVRPFEEQAGEPDYSCPELFVHEVGDFIDL